MTDYIAVAMPSGLGTDLLRAAFGAFANDAVITVDAPHRMIKLGAKGTTVCQVNLPGRATSVPFTAVTTGRKRTATDNATVAVSCAR
jgi:hypothetical protein